MNGCIITLPSMTLAQKARTVLAANNLTANVTKLPPILAEKGCGWGVSISCHDQTAATHILTVSDIPYKKVWRQDAP